MPKQAHPLSRPARQRHTSNRHVAVPFARVLVLCVRTFVIDFQDIIHYLTNTSPIIHSAQKRHFTVHTSMLMFLSSSASLHYVAWHHFPHRLTRCHFRYRSLYSRRACARSPRRACPACARGRGEPSSSTTTRSAGTRSATRCSRSVRCLQR